MMSTCSSADKDDSMESQSRTLVNDPNSHNFPSEDEAVNDHESSNDDNNHLLTDMDKPFSNFTQNHFSNLNARPGSDDEMITDSHDTPKVLQERISNLCKIIDNLSLSMEKNLRNFTNSIQQEEEESNSADDITEQMISTPQIEEEEDDKDVEQWPSLEIPSESELQLNHLESTSSDKPATFQRPKSWRNSSNRELDIKKHQARISGNKKFENSIQSNVRLIGRVSPRKVITPKFEDAFRAVCRNTGVHKSGVMISKIGSNVWLKNAALIDEKFTEKKANDYFVFFAGKKVVMSIQEYVQFLKVLTFEKKTQIQEVIEILSQCVLDEQIDQSN